MKINQYELVLGMAQFIRKYPDDPIVQELKQCKSQSDQFVLFSRPDYLLNRRMEIMSDVNKDRIIV